MANKKPSPLQAAFWLTNQEKRYILIICGLFLLGLAVRYFYLNTETPKVYTPAEMEKTEASHE